MCGITGYIAKNKSDERINRVFNSLLLAMEERGTDSTGIAVRYATGKEVKMVRSLHPAHSFLTSPAYRKLMGPSPVVAIAHTRQRTSGAISIRNAHPLKVGSLTGIHNGVIFNSVTLNPKEELDSRVLFEQLGQFGVEEGIGRVHGTYAIAFLDQKQEGIRNLNLLRHLSPLCAVRVAEAGVVFFASTSLPLITIVSAGFPGVKYDDFFTLKEDRLYTFNYEGEELDIKRKDLELPEDNSFASSLDHAEPGENPRIDRRYEREMGYEDYDDGEYPTLAEMKKDAEEGIEYFEEYLRMPCFSCGRKPDLFVGQRAYLLRDMVFLCPDCWEEDPEPALRIDLKTKVVLTIGNINEPTEITS